MSEPRTTEKPDLVDLINSALFHFWDCDGGCGMLHSAMAKLASAVGYGVSLEHAAEIAAYEGKRVEMTMEIHNVES